MRQWMKILCGSITAMGILFHTSQAVLAEEFLPGGTASLSAISCYTTWKQFSQPNWNTPAIDEDGCLNYSLAKMTVRYNLPISNVNIFTNSYYYYVQFTETVISGSGTKISQFFNTYGIYTTRLDTTWISGGTLEDKMRLAYEICASYGDSNEWCFILQMTTKSGSSHYVMVDHVDLYEGRLYLLDSGSSYVQYLGDSMTLQKEYSINTVYAFQFTQIPGDCNGDRQLTEEDAKIIMYGSAVVGTKGDANHDGKTDLADAVYIMRASDYN